MNDSLDDARFALARIIVLVAVLPLRRLFAWAERKMRP